MDEEKNELQARPYQIDLYEKAVKANSIVYLPTGSGKTYIATLLVKKFSTDVRKPLEDGGKRIALITNTVALMHQQSLYLSLHVGLPCKGYSGDMGVDFWDDNIWGKEIQDHSILVMTADIFKNIINYGYISLSQMSLLIFDECHHAVDNHPMRLILQKLENVPFDSQPRILGLTAVLLNSNIPNKGIATYLETLKTTMHSQIITVDNYLEVKDYATQPKEAAIKFQKPISFAVSEKIISIIEEVIQIVKLIELPTVPDKSDPNMKPKSKQDRIKNILTNITSVFKELGLYAGSKTLLFRIIQLEYLKKSAVYVNVTTVYTYVISKLVLARALAEKEMEGLSEIHKINRYSTNKLLKLCTLLKNFNANKLESQKFSCIIFVERRTSVEIINHVLKNLSNVDDNFKFLHSGFIVGEQGNPYSNIRENFCISKRNKDTIHKFRDGTLNCLVATDVIDEGIDISVCTLVVHFSFPRDFRAYVQSKGRARNRLSHYDVFIEENDEKSLKKYKTYQETEQILNNQLCAKRAHRHAPTEEMIKSDMYTSEFEEYNSYDQETGLVSTVDIHSSVPLIYQYCANLYKSKFVTLRPIWNLIQVDEKFESNGRFSNEDSDLMPNYIDLLQDFDSSRNRVSDRCATSFEVTLQMPSICSMNKVIKSGVYPRIDIAKKAAALKTCIELHKSKELTDRLLPKTEKDVLIKLDHLFPHWPKNKENGKAKISTKRHHPIKYADCLYNAYPEKDKDLYLHILELKPAYSVPEEHRRMVFHDIVKKKSTFAILSSKKMPQVPQFPIYMRDGEVMVKIHTNHSTIRLSQENIENLLVFHTLIFTEIIGIIKEFMIFDRMNLENCFLVVPVDDEWKIDMNVATKYQKLDFVKPTVRGHLDSFADYDLSVVTPNYRGYHVFYIVTDVCDDLTPESPFPEPSFNNYVDYFYHKHEQTVTNTKQPMLEVKPVTKKINYIKPRKPSTYSSERKRVEEEDFAEHLIPELCEKVEFPSLYWLKATALPSIMHRMASLLIADELRGLIAREIGLGDEVTNGIMQWRPMVLNEEESRRLERSSSDEDLSELINDDSQEEDSDEEEMNDEKCIVVDPESDVLNRNSTFYPWEPEDEPRYLYEDVENCQLIHIEDNYNFMNKVTSEDIEIQKNQNKICEFRTVDHTVQVPELKLLSKRGGIGPEPVDILQALTNARSNDAFNLERLETLGDAFLKFATCFYLYEYFPTYSEGHLTSIKGKIVGNKNLYYCALAKKLPEMLLVDEFQPNSNSITPAYTLPRELQKLMKENEICPNFVYEFSMTSSERLSGIIEPNNFKSIVEKLHQWNDKKLQTGIEHHLGLQVIADKNIADSVEALIGVYLQKSGVQCAMQILNWFGILPELSYEKMFVEPHKNPLIQDGDPEEILLMANIIEERIGYKFNNRAYLLQAMTHPSFSMNTMTQCYERLEFLGDALLDFLITVYIYETFAHLTPGGLTDLRSALVNNITFACLAVRHGLHAAFLSFAPVLEQSIDAFVRFQEQRKYVIDDELIHILLEEDECKLAEYVEVPKALGDIFESTIGAIYLDSGKDINKVWQIVYKIMHEEIEKFGRDTPKNCIRLVFETPKASPTFHKSVPVSDTNAVMVPLEVTIQEQRYRFYGFGMNKKQAKFAAAKQALRQLRKKTPVDIDC